MIHTVTSVKLPVDETLSIRKNRITSPDGDNGKRFSLVTGIHGDELEGQYVCFEVIQRLREHPEHLHGIVDIYPDMNPLGIATVTRGIPDFDLDMNRIFPGHANGDMNEYMASQLIDDLVGSTMCMDIHASNMYLTEVPQIRINELTADRLVPLARYANVDFVWVHGAATVLESTLAHSLNMRGVDTLVVETGIGMRITRSYCEQITDGIFSLLAHIGMWTGEVRQIKHPIVSADPQEVAFINAPVCGILINDVCHGEHLQAGQRIGRIIDPLQGIVLNEVISPCDGWLFTLREYPTVDEGSLIARILRRKE